MKPEDVTNNLLHLLEYDGKLKAMTDKELILEVLGSKASDYRCVVALMNRVLPGWENMLTAEDTENHPESLEKFDPVEGIAALKRKAKQLEDELTQLKTAIRIIVNGG